MSLEIKVTTDVSVQEFRELAAAVQDRRTLYARIAGETEKFVKQAGPGIAAQNHRTADTLGARRTGHLEKAYAGIEGTSDALEARLLVPRASRLRAAFGTYTVRPVNGKKYLTIPVHPDAYGRRAGEIEDLFFMRTGKTGTPVLARRVEGPRDIALRASPRGRRAARRFTSAEILYVLAAEATIPEQPGLIPFEEIEETAALAAGEWIDEQVERSLGL